MEEPNIGFYLDGIDVGQDFNSPVCPRDMKLLLSSQVN
jgi:hypothetical protein